MNKKFLSAILFGALMVTSTSTFVSCKDYDDDINGLQEQIDGLKSSLTTDVTTLKTDLAAAKTELQNDITAAETKAAQAKEAAEAAKTKAEQALNDLAGKASASELETAKTNLQNLTDKVNQIDEDLKDEIDGLKDRISAVEELEDRLDALKGQLDTTSSANTTALNGIKSDLEDLETELNDLFGKTLTSLVLNPQLYYGGIEAVQVSAIEYNALTLAEVCADEDHATDAAVVAATKTQMTPLLTATYHMNPSTADLSGLTKENFKFLFEDKVYKSRATGLTCEILDFDTETSKGDVIVSAKFTNGAFAEGDKVTTLALEVELEEGKTITSDYAAVYAEKITGFVLDNEKTNPTNPASVTCDPLYTTAALAIDNTPVAKVAWNQTVDLAEYVETHYETTDANGATVCALLPEATLKGYGFSYKYELVGYTDGTNLTSQSAHAALDGSKLRPQLPKDGKAAAWGATEQSQATVGRMPLVRVTLVDTNSNKNVAVAYVKVEITATPGINTIGATASYTFNKAFTLSCATTLDAQKVAWYQIEETILAQLGISKAEFEANYTYDSGKLYDKVALDATALTTNVPDITVVEGTDILTGTPIVKLNGNEIIYQDEVVAKALLNAAGRNELAKNVTATILVKETNTCGKSLVKLNNNTFDVKFLRPITVTQATMDSFKDGVDVNAIGSKVDLKLNFTDWRNYAFTNDYFTHYGVTDINADTSKATTNVSGTWTALPTGMSLTYTPASTISLTDYGYLTYKNNNTEVGNFSIKVPVTVTYIWGTIELVVEIQVAKTV